MEYLVISLAVTIIILLIIAATTQRSVNDRGGCPECGTPVPLVRRPRSFHQALWGGLTCDGCGTELDRQGRRVSA